MLLMYRKHLVVGNFLFRNRLSAWKTVLIISWKWWYHTEGFLHEVNYYSTMFVLQCDHSADIFVYHKMIKPMLFFSFLFISSAKLKCFIVFMCLSFVLQRCLLHLLPRSLVIVHHYIYELKYNTTHALCIYTCTANFTFPILLLLQELSLPIIKLT